MIQTTRRKEKYMQELNISEIEEVAGGNYPEASVGGRLET